MTSLSGHFLVASPKLPDDNFLRTVVLMLEHNEEGAFGLVLNRPTNRTIGEVWDEISDLTISSDDPIYLGGPVPGPLIALHADESCMESSLLSQRLFVTTQHEHLRQLATESRGTFRVFENYSGWGAGQLDMELKLGGWLTTLATVEEIFSDHNTLWERVTRRINLDILSSVMDPSEGPEQAWLN